MQKLRIFVTFALRAILFCGISAAMIASGSRPPAGAVCKGCVEDKQPIAMPPGDGPTSGAPINSGTPNCQAMYHISPSSTSGYGCGDFLVLGTREDAVPIFPQTMSGLYLHLGGLETLGVGLPPWNSLASLTVTLDNTSPTNGNAERVDWRMPVTIDGKTSYIRARSGFHFVRLDHLPNIPRTNGVFQYVAARVDLESGTNHQVFTSALGVHFDPDVPSPKTFTIHDGRIFASEDLVLQRGMGADPKRSIYTMVAIQFTSPLSLKEKDLAPHLKVRSAEGTLLAAGWTLGPDSTTVFGAVEGDFNALTIEFDGSVKSLDGRAIDQASLPDLSSVGLTLSLK